MQSHVPTSTILKYLEKEAIVTTVIRPYKSGRVSFRGSWWFARCDHNTTIHPGTTVYVIGMHNLTLLVALNPDGTNG